MMKKQLIISFTACLFICCCTKAFGQSGSNASFDRAMNFEIINDTLVSSTGLKFYAGQKLIIGQPAGQDGYFRSIIHKSAALVPSIWGQDARYPYAIENHVNKKKSREKVKATLVPGNSVIIKSFGYSKTGKPYFYIVSFAAGEEDFNCDIKFALGLNELLLQQ